MNDSEKLDWLEKNFLSIVHDGATRTVDMSGNNLSLRYFDENGMERMVRAQTIREAIDKGMNPPITPNH